jgi:hypothetical protein
VDAVRCCCGSRHDRLLLEGLWFAGSHALDVTLKRTCNWPSAAAAVAKRLRWLFCCCSSLFTLLDLAVTMEDSELWIRQQELHAARAGAGCMCHFLRPATTCNRRHPNNLAAGGSLPQLHGRAYCVHSPLSLGVISIRCRLPAAPLVVVQVQLCTTVHWAQQYAALQHGHDVAPRA